VTDLQTIQRLAEKIYQEHPDPVARFILLRDIFMQPSTSEELNKAQLALEKSRWVHLLENEQWPDGSWGRLHSKDSKSKQVIPTTEYAVERALCLGLNPEHYLLQNASRYLIKILEGRIKCRDREELNDRWDTGVQLFAASSLARITFEAKILDDIWQLWLDITRRTFTNGFYDPIAEIRAHRDLTGASVKNSYLVLNNKYTLALLSSRLDQIPANLEKALLNWLWSKQDGIGYLGESLFQMPSVNKAGQLERWFTSIELVSRFPGWVTFSEDIIAWLWNIQNSDGYWDLGPKSTSSVMLPLSDNWRRKGARQIDWTIRVLLLLMAYYSRI
jgi:hypothetical protein